MNNIHIYYVLTIYNLCDIKSILFCIYLLMQSKGDLIGKQAKDGAQGKSQGDCLLYVAHAVQRALGYNQGPIGVNSAKDSGPFFAKFGYKNIGAITSGFQNGDLMIVDASTSNNGKEHPHGHVQIYYMGKWYSDFAQQNINPYGDRHPVNYTVYRIN